MLPVCIHGVLAEGSNRGPRSAVQVLVMGLSWSLDTLAGSILCDLKLKV